MDKLMQFMRDHSRWLGIGFIVLSFIVNGLFDMPPFWGWTPTVLVLVLLNRHLIPQYWAMVWVRIKYGLQLPDKENYICKSDYILPFTGKWCVFDGGATKELSIAWSEMSQRYAYYFLMFDEDGNVNTKHNAAVENYYCYGKDVLATADGVVVQTSANHPDSKVDGMKAHCDTWDVKGNHIVIKHNDREYSYVGHLMPNSVTIKVGDRVKQGDVIAKCGNSGYTGEPHLHFQLQSSKSFNLSAGLPLAFTNIQAKDSAGYELWYQQAGVERPSTKGNLEVVGNKSYIGRGFDVKNGPPNTPQ
ncbi:MAG: M23 family metallopeptidase [Oscillospiraceae bacterium]|nr:M23 family metallopeptidase [Oscillospiraceae bacterium]